MGKAERRDEQMIRDLRQALAAESADSLMQRYYNPALLSIDGESARARRRRLKAQPQAGAALALPARPAAVDPRRPGAPSNSTSQ